MNNHEIVVSEEGTIPLYVLQPHELSRGIYKMKPNARKTIALAMAYRKLRHKLIEHEEHEEYEATDILEVIMPIRDFFEAFGIAKTLKGITLLNQALKEITEFSVGIYKNNTIEYVTWIQYARIDPEKNEIEVKFAEDILKYLDGNELGYCRLMMKDIAELNSFYAFRWLELAQSYESMAGTKGNKKDEWWFERNIEEIRELFGIKAEEYKTFHDLKKRAIENPLTEINNSTIGFTLTPEYKADARDKRKVKAVKIHCKRKERRLKDNNITMTNGKTIVKAAVPPVTIIQDDKPNDKTATNGFQEVLEAGTVTKTASEGFIKLLEQLAKAKNVKNQE